MTTPNVPFHDRLYRLSQVGRDLGVQLVRVTALLEANRYQALPVEFAAGGGTQPAEQESLVVTNLAEPADASGQIAPGTEAVAIDVEGRWVIHLAPPQQATFPAKVVASLTGAAYTVREQTGTGAGTFADRAGAADVTAHNLAELSLGSGAAVDDGTLVLVSVLVGTGNPPVLRYVFDHPVYAKYLD